MATMKRRNSRSTSKGRIRPASEVRGRGAVSTARRKIAKGAGRISRQLNREIA